MFTHLFRKIDRAGQESPLSRRPVCELCSPRRKGLRKPKNQSSPLAFAGVGSRGAHKINIYNILFIVFFLPNSWAELHRTDTKMAPLQKSFFPLVTSVPVGEKKKQPKSLVLAPDSAKDDFAEINRMDIDISLKYSGYITPIDLKGPLNHYMDMGLDFKHYRNLKSWFYGAELLSLISLNETSQRYLSIPDLFVGYKWSPITLNGYNFSFVLGRYKQLHDTQMRSDKENPSSLDAIGAWSFMDEVWSLGLWQGRTNWDYLQPKPMGLIGSFFTIAKNKWLFTLFLSGLFLPDHSPSIEIENGKISSVSRWFVSPQSKFIVFNQKFQSFYWLKKPYLKNVVLNDSVAVRFRFGSQDNQWFNLAYTYKPINQTYFKVDNNFSINKKAIDTIIYYQAFKHSLISMDFGLKKNIFTSVLSVIQESPNQPHIPENWIAPILPRGLFLSSYFALNLKPYHLPIELLNFNFLYSLFVDQKRVVSNGGEHLKLDMNINRFRLYHGFSVSAYSRKFQWKNQSVSLGLSYWYSIPEKGGWLSASIKWHIKPHLIIKSGVDIIGQDRGQKQGGFFDLYKQNDRITLQLVYVIK
ncbi:MAG: hypothetical protein OXM55_03090 [Bdellovibrionales bacterium]|nr:hypothetical protein [Bdellovibrionales bacterium]